MRKHQLTITYSRLTQRVKITIKPSISTSSHFPAVLSLSISIPYMKSESEVAQSCPTLCDRMDCSLPGSSVHGVLQARILEWVAISFSRGPSGLRDWTWVSRFNLWAAICIVHIINDKHNSFSINSTHPILKGSLTEAQDAWFSIIFSLQYL